MIGYWLGEKDLWIKKTRSLEALLNADAFKFARKQNKVKMVNDFFSTERKDKTSVVVIVFRLG